MVLFFFKNFLVNVVQIKVGGFEDMFVCIVTITYYYLLTTTCGFFFLFRSGCMGIVWAWYGMGMVKQDGLDGMG